MEDIYIFIVLLPFLCISIFYNEKLKEMSLLKQSGEHTKNNIVIFIIMVIIYGTRKGTLKLDRV